MNARRFFDHLVGAQQNRRRDFDADGLGGLQIDDQLELGWPLDRQVGRYGPFGQLIHVVGSAPETNGPIL
jgi:hypothetical protein